MQYTVNSQQQQQQQQQQPSQCPEAVMGDSPNTKLFDSILFDFRQPSARAVTELISVASVKL